ncbi:bifunctional diguanylate cyclase/phosphodiesterase [Labrenzia sp. PHM005]|uniref:putative bifunctional diguanylate cyclase/phosphodiesterase n=1 Tax=Labrenzia sp. PHM005 TaxID=2590016 RepID=UPI00113FDE09|nr:EAL domain-containing protein [Labrenzia sp. PHM005]QDG78445.1 EAL domain-containing protein [Labrenzia sp. PHM005]
MRIFIDKAKDFARWTLVRDCDPELALAQCKELNFQIPLLYVLLMLNAIAVSFTHRDVAPTFLTIGILVPILLLTIFRLLVWVRSRHDQLTPDQAINKLRRTVIMASVISVIYITWSLSLDSYGGPTERGHVALFIAITVIGCIFCLMHLPQAAIMVMLIVTVPYLVHYLGQNEDVYTAIALNIFLVCLVILKVLFNGYFAFSDLIKSRSELSAKQRETELLNAENERLSQTDYLTDLPNRRHFFKRLDQHIKEAASSDSVFAVGVIDLDQFKPVNDTYGHQIGDQLLTAVGARLEELSLPGLEISRLGGDEFGLLFPGGPDTAPLAARTVCDGLQQPFQIGDLSISIGASCGLAFYPEAGETAHALFDRSDYALYNSKASSRGSLTIYSADHEAKMRSTKAIESALQSANIREEFEVHFQPIVALPDQKVVGFEALARWTSPKLGSIPPDVFIQVAERTGQIQRLTIQFFTMAIEQINNLPDHIKLGFNLSAHDITSPETVARLLDIIKTNKINPKRVTFELTETSVIGNYDAAVSCLHALRNAGCRLALDDFGTGYSSLSYLHRLPIDCVKVDRSFVANLSDPVANGVITSVVNLCQSMQLVCVVEGVEQESQAEALKDMNCQLVQGFLFSRPRPFSEIETSIGNSGTVAGLPLTSEIPEDLLRRSAM